MTTAPDPAEAAFLAAIVANPDDDTNRLVYADWLDERDDPRAEFLRLLVDERRRGLSGLPGSRAHLLVQPFDGRWVSTVTVYCPWRLPDSAGTYDQWIGRDRPGCVVFLVSRAGWLRSARLGDTPIAELFARLVNRALGELITSCEFGEENPRPFFHIALIGYGTDRAGNAVVGPLFSGPLAGRDLITVQELYDHPIEIERVERREQADDGSGGLTEVLEEFNRPVWYRAGGGLWSGSPVRAGLDYINRLTRRWIDDHPDNFPPFVFHLTDGSMSDGDPTGSFEELKSLTTNRGSVFLINVLYGEQHGEAAILPAVPPAAGGDAARRCHDWASPLPGCFRWALELRGVPTAVGSRALAVNTSPLHLLRLLPTGSDPLLSGIWGWQSPHLH